MDGMNLIQAAETIDRLTKRYESFVSASETLKRIGSLATYEQETRKRIEKLRAEEDALRGIVALDDAAKAANARKEQALADEKAVAERLEAASAKLKDVQEQATKTAQQAQEKATGLVAEAQRKADTLAAQERKVRESIASAERELAGINEKITQARAVQANLREQLAKAAG